MADIAQSFCELAPASLILAFLLAQQAAVQNIMSIFDTRAHANLGTLIMQQKSSWPLTAIACYTFCFHVTSSD